MKFYSVTIQMKVVDQPRGVWCLRTFSLRWGKDGWFSKWATF